MQILFLNSISGGEILVVLLIVLMLFGAESIPNIARTMGRTIRQIKDASQDIQRDIQDAAKNSTSEIRKIEKGVNDIVDDDNLKV